MTAEKLAMIPHNEEWQAGFETGAAYAMMVAGCSQILGVYHSRNEEDLFLFASQFGYECFWKPMMNGFSQIEFVRRRDWLNHECMGEDAR